MEMRGECSGKKDSVSLGVRISTEPVPWEATGPAEQSDRGREAEKREVEHPRNQLRRRMGAGSHGGC